MLTYSKLFRTVKTSLDDSSMSNIAADKSRRCLMPFFVCVETQSQAASHTDDRIKAVLRREGGGSKTPHRDPSHLKDAVAVLRQRRGRVGRVHLRELLGKVADVQLVPDHGLEGGGHLLSRQVLPVDFLKREGTGGGFLLTGSAPPVSSRQPAAPGRRGVSSRSPLHRDPSPVFSLDL